MILTRLVFLTLLCLAVSGIPWQGAPEEKPPQKMSVTNEMLSFGISIEARIANERDSPITVPFCGKRQQRYVVCLPPGSLEQYDGSTWNRVEPTPEHMFGQLPSPPLATIEPHGYIDVETGFGHQVFQWKRGQPVRVVIPAWLASDMSRTPQNVIQYTTGPLEPPSTGDLAFTEQHSGSLQASKITAAPEEYMELAITNEYNFDVVIATCGKSEIDGRPYGCLPPGFFEQYDGSKWRVVDSTSESPYAKTSKSDLLTVTPHQSIKIDMGFVPDAYKWRVGQPVRLVFHGWPRSDTVKDPKNAIRYVTDPLGPPSAGEFAFKPH